MFAVHLRSRKSSGHSSREPQRIEERTVVAPGTVVLPAERSPVGVLTTQREAAILEFSRRRTDGPLGVQMQDREAFFESMTRIVRDAEAALVRGEAGPFMQMWSHNDPVSLFGAVGVSRPAGRTSAERSRPCRHDCQAVKTSATRSCRSASAMTWRGPLASFAIQARWTAGRRPSMPFVSPKCW